MSLVEVLVSIAVIAILLALAAPSLRSTRLAAESTLCISRLADIGVAFATSATDSKGNWPNLFEDDLHAPYADFNSGQIMVRATYWSQVQTWAGSLIGTIWEEDTAAAAWTCPAVLKSGWGLSGGREQLLNQPIDGAIASYFYSACLISDPALWNSSSVDVLSNPGAYRRVVGMHQVRFTDRKVALAENADFHGDRVTLANDAATQALNALFCDGHVRRTTLRGAVPPIPSIGLFNSDTEPDLVPFLGTPGGYLGFDTQGGR